jgi:hypothetical protein
MAGEWSVGFQSQVSMVSLVACVICLGCWTLMFTHIHILMRRDLHSSNGSLPLERLAGVSPASWQALRQEVRGGGWRGTG